MKLLVYPLLNPNSKRAIRRLRGRFGRRCWYYPRKDLVHRLSSHFGWTEDKTIGQIRSERAYFVRKALDEEKQ